MSIEKKVVVLLSGGLDSSTLLYEMIAEFGKEKVLALSVYYGQRHEEELTAAAFISQLAEVEHIIVELGEALGPVFEFSGSSQIAGEGITPPDGHYADDNMRVTVVPNRNMLLLSVAGACAVSRKAGIVAYAAHVGDHAQYPDCRQPFIDAMASAFLLCDFRELELLAPFSALTKAEIAKRAAELGVPIEFTRSCYASGSEQCGKCGTCVERREAFHLAGVLDPTEYADKTEYWKTVCGGIKEL